MDEGTGQKDLERIRIIRVVFTDKSTIGDLYFDEGWECFTLEDTCRTKKIDHITAIPPGKYRITLTHSDRFNRIMPELMNVPGYTGVRIHPGNVPDDSSGCILVGRKHGIDSISESIAAYDALLAKIELAIKEGPLYASIVGGSHHKVDKHEAA